MSPLEDGLFFVSLWITFPGFYFSKLLESLGGGLPSMKLCKRLGYLPAGARFLQEVKTRNRSVSLGDWGKNAMKLIKQFFGFGHKSDLSFFSMLFQRPKGFSISEAWTEWSINSRCHSIFKYGLPNSKGISCVYTVEYTHIFLCIHTYIHTQHEGACLPLDGRFPVWWLFHNDPYFFPLGGEHRPFEIENVWIWNGLQDAQWPFRGTV